MAGGYLDRSVQAFSVEIPLIPPKTNLPFTLWTISDVNQKSCTYLKTTILSEQRRKIGAVINTTNDKTLDA
jgi:hypothetical protein